MSKGKLLSWSLYLLIVIAAAASLGRMGLLDPTRLARGSANTWVFATDLFPPNLGVLDVLLPAIGETLQIAFVGTLLGFVVALPFAFVGTRNLFGPWIISPVRVLLGVVRTIPSLLWALIFVIALGLGPAAGALGIAFYTLGYLGKLYYEALEGVDYEVIEAVKSVGCNRAQLMRYALLPEAANNILSQLLFIFEYNVRASAIMGFVGAGGIGFYMLGYIQMLQYQNLMTAILATLVVVLLIDYMSSKVRGWVLPPSRQASLTETPPAQTQN